VLRISVSCMFINLMNNNCFLVYACSKRMAYTNSSNVVCMCLRVCMAYRPVLIYVRVNNYNFNRFGLRIIVETH